MRFNGIETLAGGLLGFVYPSLLHGFEDALAATLRVVIKLGQIEDELAQMRWVSVHFMMRPPEISVRGRG